MTDKIGGSMIGGILSILSLFYAGTFAFAYTDSEIRAVETDEERQLNEIRDQEITQLKIVQGRRSAQNRQPDLLLRLAEIYIEKYKHYFLKENEVHHKKLHGGEKPRQVEHTRSRSYLIAANNACLSILKSHVRFDKMDQVYYFLAYNAEELGHTSQALKYHHIVVTQYSQSAYAAESERSIGQNAFDRHQYRDAIKWFERSASHKNMQSRPRVLYKLAWAYFKTRRYNDALNTMKQVVVLSGTEGKFVSLREEALSDLVSFYSEAGRPKEARAYFSEIPGGAEIYIQSLKRLTGVYERTGRYSMAIHVSQELLSQYADSKPELTFDVLGNLVELYRKAGDGAGEEKALKNLVDFFAQHGTQIADTSEDAKLALERTKKYLRNRATDIHKEAQKKKQIVLFSRAADLYALYIRAFLSHDLTDTQKKELSEVRAYRADALLQCKRENEAMSELAIAMKDEGDVKYRREAGNTLLNLYLRRIDERLKNNKNGTDLKDLQSRFESAADEYERRFPQDKLIPELRYKRARLLVAQGEDSSGRLPREAKVALEDFIEKFPQRSESLDVARDLVARDAKAGRMDEALDRAQAYLKNTALMHTDKSGEFRKFLESIGTRKSFEDVQSLEKGHDYEKAAHAFEQLAQNTKDGEVALKALNNASVNYEKAGRISESVRVTEILLDKLSNNKTKIAGVTVEGLKSNLKRAASRYLWDSQFHQAAQLFVRFAHSSHFAKQEKLDLLHTASRLEWGSGETQTAIDILRQGIDSWCLDLSQRSCHTMYFDLAALYQEASREQETVDLLKKYISRASRKDVRKAEAHFIMAQMYLKFHETKQAALHFEEASRTVTAGPRREINFAAHAAFNLIEPLYQRFLDLKLEQPDAVLKTRTKQKLDLLEGLTTRYNRVVSMGDGEWGIAALERLGSAFVLFGQELQSVPPPSGLQGPGLVQYKQGILNVARPLINRGLEFLGKAYQKGLALDVTTTSFVRVTLHLAQFQPRQYVPAHYVISPQDGDDAGRGLLIMGVRKEPSSTWRQDIARRLNASPKQSETWVEFGNLELLSGHPVLARLLYEEALQLNSRSQAATNNLGVLEWLEGDVMAATSAMKHALVLGDFAKEPKANAVKLYLRGHHFIKTVERARGLAGRYADDKNMRILSAVSDLGANNFAAAHSKLEDLNAKSSNLFSLWYNWCVWAVYSDGSQRRAALEKLQDEKSDYKAGMIERELIEGLLKIAANAGKAS